MSLVSGTLHLPGFDNGINFTRLNGLKPLVARFLLYYKHLSFAGLEWACSHDCSTNADDGLIDFFADKYKSHRALYCLLRSLRHGEHDIVSESMIAQFFDISQGKLKRDYVLVVSQKRSGKHRLLVLEGCQTFRINSVGIALGFFGSFLLGATTGFVAFVAKALADYGLTQVDVAQTLLLQYIEEHGLGTVSFTDSQIELVDEAADSEATAALLPVVPVVGTCIELVNAEATAADDDGKYFDTDANVVPSEKPCFEPMNRSFAQMELADSTTAIEAGFEQMQASV